MVRERMTEILRVVLYGAYRFLPKWNHAVVWAWPVGEDNSRALIPALLSSPVVSKVILLVSDIEVAFGCFPAHPSLRFVKKDSPQAWKWFLTARYVFFTHRCLMWKFPPQVVSVNIWHGMPIKRIGWMLEGERGIRSRYALATSDFWKPIIEESMRPWDAVLSCGLPRNDRLFCSRIDVMRKMRIADRQDVKHLVAWLPTYRSSVRGEIRCDGDESGSVFGLPDVDPVDLNDFAANHNLLIWVKPHPMSAMGRPVEMSHLIVLDDAGLAGKNVSLYELLGASDLLVSDVSSVVVDYLLLDRPVIHCFPDVESYRRSRGFTVAPIEDYFMGPLVTSLAALKQELAAFSAGADPFVSQRRMLQNRFHQHTDGLATRRLLQMLHLDGGAHTQCPGDAGDTVRFRVLAAYISAVCPRQVVDRVMDMVTTRERGYIHVCTVHTMLECVDDPQLAAIVNTATLAVPDGMPLVWLGRKAFPPAGVQRCYGPDLMLAVCEAGIAMGMRHCLYGGTPDVLEKLAQNLEARFPGIRIVESMSPPFRPLTDTEQSDMVERINAARPDVVWVGLGTPKQDLWMGCFRSRLDAPVLIAVGAAFDFHAGKMPQAPRWMQRAGLEWLFRLCKEPRRLWRRYVLGNPRFLWLLWRQRMRGN